MRVVSGTAREPREEARRAGNVVRVFRARTRHALFQQLLAGDVQQEVRHQDRREDRGDPDRVIARDEPQPPPQAGVAEIVRVTAVAPQPVIEHAAAIGGIAFETRELPIRNSLEKKTDRPQPHADDRYRTEDWGRYQVLCELNRDGDQPHEKSLQEEDFGQRVPVQVGWVPIAERSGVTRVFTFADIAPVKVAAEPGGPDDGQYRNDQVAQLDTAAVGKRIAHQRDDAERRTPEDIDDADVAQANAEQPQQQHAREQRCRGNPQVLRETWRELPHRSPPLPTSFRTPSVL